MNSTELLHFRACHNRTELLSIVGSNSVSSVLRNSNRVQTMKDEKQIELVWGAGAIAELIGRTPRATFHMLDNGELPAKKVGSRWVAEKGELVRFFRGAAA